MKEKHKVGILVISYAIFLGVLLTLASINGTFNSPSMQITSSAVDDILDERGSEYIYDIQAFGSWKR